MLKTSLWSITGIILASVLVRGWCHYAENPKSYFASYNDAEKSGIMKRGWIPTYIPKSSLAIKETHNLDINSVEMSFNFTPGDSDDVEKNCVGAEPIANGKQYQCEYFGNKVTIKLYSNGKAELFSYSE